jgi:hypothetical protein
VQHGVLIVIGLCASSIMFTTYEMSQHDSNSITW